ncbi:YwqI/YxiC family protein [Listeria booriae]|uniref:YwqI/YxiC family protein n=1 Tax=Listeria booriae TaxID=1552123 RepID=A0A842G8J3_9LIST|nr:DUF5344 family protein [Listeria booriae]MBC2292913.1 YwqI/YxiC family protein [Listeria booriae]
MSEVHIDPTILEQEIGILKSLLNTKITRTKGSISNKGKASEKMNEVQMYYDTLNETLDLLIQNTASFLENAKDAYIDTDEASAAILEQLMGGSE